MKSSIISIQRKNDSIQLLTITNIQNIIKYILFNRKRPDFMSISNKLAIKCVNLVFIDSKHKFRISKSNNIPYKNEVKIFKYLQNVAFSGLVAHNYTFYQFIEYIKYDSRINIVREINTRNRKKHKIKLTQKFKLRIDTSNEIETTNEDENKIEDKDENKIEDKDENKIDDKIEDNHKLNAIMKTHRKQIEKYINLELITLANIQHFLIKDYHDIYNAEYLYHNESAEIYNYESFTTFENTSDHFLVSIDCEMVITDKGFQVGRVTLVNHQNVTLYDKYVLPINTIIDYVTEYSGLTENSFKNAIKYEQMKEELKTFIGKNTVILGHALHNDLKVLRIKHKKLIDTSFLFMKKDGMFIKLQMLSVTILAKSIQNSNHSSVEDAKACVELLALCIGEYFDFRNRENEIDVFRDMFRDVGSMNENGINILDLSGNEKLDVSLNGFNIFFCESEDGLRFII